MPKLTQAELAAIYRRLRPHTFYAGDPPEKWTRAVLIRQIRSALTEEALMALRLKLSGVRDGV